MMRSIVFSLVVLIPMVAQAHQNALYRIPEDIRQPVAWHVAQERYQELVSKVSEVILPTEYQQRVEPMIHLGKEVALAGLDILIDFIAQHQDITRAIFADKAPMIKEKESRYLTIVTVMAGFVDAVNDAAQASRDREVLQQEMQICILKGVYAMEQKMLELSAHYPDMKEWFESKKFLLLQRLSSMTGDIVVQKSIAIVFFADPRFDALFDKLYTVVSGN